MNNADDICEDIASTMLIADCTGVTYSWLAESGVRHSDEPLDPQFLVFKDFYEYAQQLHQEYLPQEIELAIEQFPYLQREGRLFMLYSDRSQELQMLQYCLHAIREQKDCQTAFRKRTN
ncbi:MAG TPA: hypothetical protein VJI32_03325 [Candidatus Nanoarchaeia archaeon]|nr:hypothetical protein [Candidatus Nanoarchaeia archaeon]